MTFRRMLDQWSQGKRFLKTKLISLWKAKGANVSGTTVPDIIKMAEDDEFSHFLAAKYPKLPTKVRYSRIRDIIRKQH